MSMAASAVAQAAEMDQRRHAHKVRKRIPFQEQGSQVGVPIQAANACEALQVTEELVVQLRCDEQLLLPADAPQPLPCHGHGTNSVVR